MVDLVSTIMGSRNWKKPKSEGVIMSRNLESLQKLNEVFAVFAGEQTSLQADKQLVQSLLGLGLVEVNKALVELYDDQLSPDSTLELEQNPSLILHLFEAVSTDYEKTEAYGYVGSILNWLEGQLESSEDEASHR